MLELIREASANLLTLRTRTALALIGIAIGTAAVIAMLHLGHTARMQAAWQFEQLGVDLVSITPHWGEQGVRTIPFDVTNALPAQKLGIDLVAPFILSGTTIRAGRTLLSATLIAATDPFFEITKARIVEGRAISAWDGFAPFVVVGAKIAADLEGATKQPVRIGSRLTVGEQVMTVVGRLAQAYPNTVLGIDLDQSIILPFAAARRLMPNPQATNVAARLSPGADDRPVTTAVTDYFRTMMQRGSVKVVTARQLIEGLDSQMRIYQLLLLAIGAVSLVVGGIGVMNVMLMSMLERRQEIGLRMAIGARQSDIRAMFLAEALLLSSAGALAGTALGTGAAWIFTTQSGWLFEASAWALPLGVGMALVVGLFFGSYPAFRAARLDPIAALRAI
jgi:putative ABC transport system permease protein